MDILVQESIRQFKKGSKYDFKVVRYVAMHLFRLAEQNEKKTICDLNMYSNFKAFIGVKEHRDELEMSLADLMKMPKFKTNRGMCSNLNLPSMISIMFEAIGLDRNYPIDDDRSAKNATEQFHYCAQNHQLYTGRQLELREQLWKYVQSNLVSLYVGVLFAETMMKNNLDLTALTEEAIDKFVVLMLEEKSCKLASAIERAISLHKKSETDANFVFHKLVEEVGEISKAMNQPQRCDEPAQNEIADAMICLIDLYCHVNGTSDLTDLGDVMLDKLDKWESRIGVKTK